MMEDRVGLNKEVWSYSKQSAFDPQQWAEGPNLPGQMNFTSCPKCGSPDIEGEFDEGLYPTWYCEDCGSQFPEGRWDPQSGVWRNDPESEAHAELLDATVMDYPSFSYDHYLENELIDEHSYSRSYDKNDLERLYQIAVRRGEIPELAAAHREFDETQYENFQTGHDSWEDHYYFHEDPSQYRYYVQNPDQYDWDSYDEWDEEQQMNVADEAWEKYQDEQADEDTGLQASRDLWNLLAPHVDAQGVAYNQRVAAEFEETEPCPYCLKVDSYGLDELPGVRACRACGMAWRVTDEPTRPAEPGPSLANPAQDPINSDITDWAVNYRPTARFHGWTGKLLPQRISAIENPGLNMRKLLKQPGKRLQTPEAESFLQWLADQGEAVDPLVPFLANQFKKGVIGWNPFDPNPFDPMPSSPGEPVWNRDPHPSGISHLIPQWAEWYNAREHPLRRGVNVQDPEFGIEQIQNLSRQHQQALEKERERMQHIERMKYKDTPIVHTFPNDWTVRQLRTEDLQDESDILKHCIGTDSKYETWLDNGSISAYSLRDPQNVPRMSWHYNDDGTLAHMQGRSGDPKDEYMKMFRDWSEQVGRPTDVTGEYEYDEEGEPYRYVEQVPVGPVDDISEWLTWIGYYDDIYERMEDYLQGDERLGEDAWADWSEGPNLWENIVERLGEDYSDKPPYSWLREEQNALNDVFFENSPSDVYRGEYRKNLDEYLRGKDASDFDDGVYDNVMSRWTPFRDEFITPDNPEPQWEWYDRYPTPERTPLGEYKWNNWPQLFEPDGTMWQQNPRRQEWENQRQNEALRNGDFSSLRNVSLGSAEPMWRRD